MPVVSAVLVLSADSGDRNACLEALAADERLTLGPRSGYRLPVVAVTDTLADDHALWKGLQRMPGVLHTEVVWAAMDETEGMP